MSLCLLAFLGMAAASCQLRDRSHGKAGADQPAAAPEPGKRIVAFAPVALGPLAAAYPEARVVYAHDLADRIDAKVEDADGQAREELPDSDAQDWSSGPVPAASGDYLVVLTRVLDITREQPIGARPAGGPVTATVEMKAIDPSDPAGPPVFFKRAKGHAAGESSAKLMGDQAKPESVAVWDACSTLIGTLTVLLNQQPVTASADSADRWIVVDIESDPTRADILVDGAFSGTTPMKLQLPRKKITVRIERQGYQPWERQLVPSRDMRIQPVLNRLGDAGTTTSPAGALRPAPVPDATAPVGSHADAGDEPAPKRAEVDETLSPPVPRELVVPDGSK
jgi:hypothetical protein